VRFSSLVYIQTKTKNNEKTPIGGPGGVFSIGRVSSVPRAKHIEADSSKSTLVRVPLHTGVHVFMGDYVSVHGHHFGGSIAG
jgi:hypothetical protein